MDTQIDENKEQEQDQDMELEQIEKQEKVNPNPLCVNAYILINEQYAKVNIEQILNPEDNIYVIMFMPKASDLIAVKFEVHFGNQSIISKVIARPINDHLEEEDPEKKLIMILNILLYILKKQIIVMLFI